MGNLPEGSMRMLDLHRSNAFIQSSLSALSTAAMSGALNPLGGARVI